LRFGRPLFEFEFEFALKLRLAGRTWVNLRAISLSFPVGATGSPSM
jgi:hypothetical protein